KACSTHGEIIQVTRWANEFRPRCGLTVTTIKRKKKAVPRLWNGLLAKSSGEEGNSYIEGGAGLPLALGCCGAAPVVFVIRRTLTRRFAARPSRVLFSSTGLSLPSPTM